MIYHLTRSKELIKKSYKQLFVLQIILFFIALISIIKAIHLNPL